MTEQTRDDGGDLREFNLWVDSVRACEGFAAIICRVALHPDHFEATTSPGQSFPDITQAEVDHLWDTLGVDDGRYLAKSDWRDIANTELNLNVSISEIIDENLAYRIGAALRRRILRGARAEQVSNVTSAKSAQNAKKKRERKDKGSVESRMWKVARKYSKEGIENWTVRDWADKVDCSTSSIHATELWRRFQSQRDAQRSERVSRYGDDEGSTNTRAIRRSKG